MVSSVPWKALRVLTCSDQGETNVMERERTIEEAGSLWVEGFNYLNIYYCTYPDQLHHVLHKAVHLHSLQLSRLVLMKKFHQIAKHPISNVL